MNTATRYLLHCLVLIIAAGVAGGATGVLHMGPPAGAIAGAVAGITLCALDPFRVIWRA